MSVVDGKPDKNFTVSTLGGFNGAQTNAFQVSGAGNWYWVGRTAPFCNGKPGGQTLGRTMNDF